MMKRMRNCLPAVLAATTIVAVIALPNVAAAAASRAHAGAGCMPVTNIEAIIDDSRSMASTDANTLRVKGLKLLIKTLGSDTFLGAVEFGGSLLGSTPSADTVFKPEPVGPNAPAMEAALDSKIKADNGTTDYNAAFAQSDADDPNAQVRIFLTDGGHNVGAYNNGHLTHKVPTYVIAFSPGVADSEAQNRLSAIAADTGGQFYPLTDSSQLQAVMNTIGAALTCQTLTQTFNDVLAGGASVAHAVPIGANTKAIQIALTWVSPLDRFSISNIRLISRGRTVARASRQVRKLKVRTAMGPTFTVLKLSGLGRGKLSFKLRATAIGSGAPKVTLTTQVSQGK